MPSSISGDSLAWKKAQKNLKKNKTSLAIKSIIPHFIPLFTIIVWNPWKVASRRISRHHWIIVSKVNIKARLRSHIEFLCIILISPVVNIKALKEPVKGQGLRSTKWNAWKDNN